MAPEWSCWKEAKPGWKLHHLCAGLCLFSVFKNTIDRFLCGKRPAEVISSRYQSIFCVLFPVPVFFWWVERMYCQVRVSSLQLSRQSKAFFRCEMTFRKWAISICEINCTNLLSRLPPALCSTQSSPPYNLQSPICSSSPCSGQRRILLQTFGLLPSVSSFNLPTCPPPHHIYPFLPPCCQGCWADWSVLPRMLPSFRWYIESQTINWQLLELFGLIVVIFSFSLPRLQWKHCQLRFGEYT